ncbi:substrate-binding periplasmic protein [Ideonella sp.]|uniref:substrate-binding periplasmic protein n=1 Tax=Ideonella sp. TaxID=1929293 RepID=UPI002B4818D8|nr:transporter substrate-binding domain-containing protein [Ideonella sp.]HJV70015.1 transporter substrate-binding domain-containing protein [Ideonella sp.]
MKLLALTGRMLRPLCAMALAWFATAASAGGGLQVVTEELPPYNMTQGGRITGMSTEVVQAVLKEADLQASIHSMPWARAYDTALNGENVLIYSITRTPQRETLFKWVGIVAPTRWYLFGRPGVGASIRSLDDARKFQIATVNEDAGEQYLVSKGFAVGKNLQSSNKYEFNYEKLKLGRVDLWIANELNALYLMRQAGDDPERQFVRVLELPDLASDGGLHLAASRKTPDATVERLRKALETVRHNGSYEAIRRHWQ